MDAGRGSPGWRENMCQKDGRGGSRVHEGGDVLKEGVKYDSEKLRYDLFPVEALEEITKVLTYGAGKYAPDNWRKVEPCNDRYFAAAMRHMIAHRKGEQMDESGYHHLAHAACCIIFMLTKELEKCGK